MEKDLETLESDAKAVEDRLSLLEKSLKEKDKASLNSIAKGGSPMSNVATGSENTDEKRCLRYFGVPHVKDLLSVNTMDPRFSKVPEELKHLVIELKRDIDVSRMTQQILNGEPLDRNERQSHVKGMLDNYYGKNVLAPKLKAFGSTVVGAGDEWVPTAISTQYIEEYELERKVAQQFRQIPMTTNPYELPVQNSVTKARIQAESGTIAGSNFGTSKLNFSATKLTEFYPLSAELDEDSAPAILSLARTEVVESEIRAVEAAILNGAKGVHIDADIEAGGAELAERSWNGLRKLALDNSANGSLVDFGGAASTLGNLRLMRQAMGKFGVNPRELVWLVSTKVYNQMLALDEVTTVERFGPMASILNGSLAALDGIPIVISEYMRDDTDATGVNLLPTDVLSVCQLVNHRRAFFGVRRPIQVKAVMNPTPPNDEWMIAAWWRGDFQSMPQSATEVSISLGHNIA
jgi:HK97 family phage major capsid protein